MLLLAAAKEGRLTAAEVALHCQLTVGESSKILDALAAQGAAQLLVADDGTVVYAIAGLLSPQAKAAAGDPAA